MVRATQSTSRRTTVLFWVLTMCPKANRRSSDYGSYNCSTVISELTTTRGRVARRLRSASLSSFGLRSGSQQQRENASGLCLRFFPTTTLPSRRVGMHHLWEISELVYAILGYLDRKDHIPALRVCRLLWEVCVPLVWHSIDLVRLEDLYSPDKQEMKCKVKCSWYVEVVADSRTVLLDFRTFCFCQSPLVLAVRQSIPFHHRKALLLRCTRLRHRSRPDCQDFPKRPLDRPHIGHEGPPRATLIPLLHMPNSRKLSYQSLLLFE